MYDIVYLPMSMDPSMPERPILRLMEWREQEQFEQEEYEAAAAEHEDFINLKGRTNG